MEENEEGVARESGCDVCARRALRPVAAPGLSLPYVPAIGGDFRDAAAGAARFLFVYKGNTREGQRCTVFLCDVNCGAGACAC